MASLETLLGAQRCETYTPGLQAYAVDGLIPKAVVWPETAEQVALVLQWAQGEKLAVIPWGSGTQIGLGGIPTRLDLVLSLRRLAQVEDYDVANFTITVGAGMTFAALARLVATHGQMLPLQYPSSMATLGGLIAVNSYSPKRLRYGGVRDLLLGLRIALPSGEIAHFGGKVVKNVAGYDMSKLFLGSLGALAIIVESTFRLFAMPERDETLLAMLPSLESGAAAVAQLMATQLQPSQILLLDAGAIQAVAPDIASPTNSAAALLLVNCEGMEEAVDWQLAEIARICQGHSASAVQVLAGETQGQFRGHLEGIMHDRQVTMPPSPLQSTPLAIRNEGALTIRLGTLPSRVSTVMTAAAQTLRRLVPGVMIIGDCGVGVVKLRLRLEGLAADAMEGTLVPALRDLARLVVGHGGVVVVETAPPDAKAQLEVWGPPPPSFPLLEGFKRQFDPAGILSPGRFIGGL
jgi:glycolate oxidase FAD binding subunit